MGHLPPERGEKHFPGEIAGVRLVRGSEAYSLIREENRALLFIIVADTGILRGAARAIFALLRVFRFTSCSVEFAAVLGGAGNSLFFIP